MARAPVMAVLTSPAMARVVPAAVVPVTVVPVMVVRVMVVRVVVPVASSSWRTRRGTRAGGIESRPPST
ncbi:hypothetical protein OG470_16355 [Micromonospora sp. NBC_00389]|uniref:hypothetical protein n=1 Tax=Micromonospora sp. NBC_00389 TaxID=2903586 RepID=UPI002E229609